jgi:hypothetical protein
MPAVAVQHPSEGIEGIPELRISQSVAGVAARLPVMVSNIIAFLKGQKREAGIFIIKLNMCFEELKLVLERINEL